MEACSGYFHDPRLVAMEDISLRSGGLALRLLSEKVDAADQGETFLGSTRVRTLAGPPSFTNRKVAESPLFGPRDLNHQLGISK